MTRLDDGQIRLRDGCSVWLATAHRSKDMPPARTREVLHTDIVIVGGGITGAFLAERFTRNGCRVVVVDRHAPAMGSTAASTAMLLWELDASLLELEQAKGAEAAGLIANECKRQVETIGALIAGLSIDCGFAFGRSLYLAGNELDAGDLREEHQLRAHLGIAGECLGEGDLGARGFIGEGGLLYPGAARADPVRLARGLLGAAQKRGARILSPATAMVYETLPDGVRVVTREQDVIHAQQLVLASGYEMPEFVPVERHRIMSTWAMATAAQGAPRWPDDALVWEASDPYLYMRSTGDGRLIVGGADEPLASDTEPGRACSDKARLLLQAGAGRWPGLANAEAEFAWTGAFGETDDSLPFIGPVPGRARCLAAYGYGGNGITFSALAADMLEARLEGRAHAIAAICALDRD